jgi:D-alanyl-D-alanine carboxypeptidase/D-alanyl-D-alanine-endopeptidase (penicillin-binding protein 4)
MATKRALRLMALALGAACAAAAFAAPAKPAGSRKTSKSGSVSGSQVAPAAATVPAPKAAAKASGFYFPKEAQLGYVLADPSAPDGEFLACRDCARNFTPGSTQKLFTTWVAMDLLGGDRTFPTELARTGTLADGVLKGDLIIQGGGDPSFAGAQAGPGRTAPAVFGGWAEALKQAGIRKIEGCVIGDGSFLEEEGPHPAELWEDAGNYYAGIVSGLCFNDNLFTAEFSGAAAPGKPVALRGTAPKHTGIARFDNRLVTGPADSRDSAYFLGGFPSPVRALRGSYPAGRMIFTLKGSLPNPAWTCAREFEAFLAAKGITVTGQGAACGDPLALPNHAPAAGTEAIAGTRIASPPLRELLRIVNQRSDNNWAAQTLALIGKGTGHQADWRGGLEAVYGWLDAHGFDRKLVHLKDGNGLSRYNWIAPSQTARLLAYAYRDAKFAEFQATLAGAPGSEGKLDRFGPGWDGRLFVKTGTLEGVSALAGYLRAKSGKWLVFAIAANNFEARNGDAQKYFAPLLKGWAEGN